MKLLLTSIALLSTSVSAFTPNAPTYITTQSSSTSTTSTTTSLNAHNDRREVLSTLLSGMSMATLTAAALTTAPQQALARREPLPEYLTEPTEAFKESERQRDEFRRAQLQIKREFNTVLDRFTFESKSEEELINDLKELRYLVKKTEGLPLGIKKDEMVKIIRAKKAKGFWPTDVEIAYQKLTSEIAYQQSPNREKDVANPL
jgi:hypothetical protein